MEMRKEVKTIINYKTFCLDLYNILPTGQSLSMIETGVEEIGLEV